MANYLLFLPVGAKARIDATPGFPIAAPFGTNDFLSEDNTVATVDPFSYFTNEPVTPTAAHVEVEGKAEGSTKIKFGLSKVVLAIDTVYDTWDVVVHPVATVEMTHMMVKGGAGSLTAPHNPAISPVPTFATSDSSVVKITATAATATTIAASIEAVANGAAVITLSRPTGGSIYTWTIGVIDPALSRTFFSQEKIMLPVGKTTTLYTEFMDQLGQPVGTGIAFWFVNNKSVVLLEGTGDALQQVAAKVTGLAPGGALVTCITPFANLTKEVYVYLPVVASGRVNSFNK